ncbi:hypothetical protein ACFLT3_00725 [Chloroflexota bacterium]
MSRFIKKLRQISENAAPPLGFKKTVTSPRRQMMLIASLPQDNVGLATQLTTTEVDSVLVHHQDLGKESKTSQQMAGSTGDIPWGAWLDEVAEEDVDKIQEAGGDFIIFVASKTPASLLEEEIGKVIKIDLSSDGDTLETIDQLPIDGILLDLTAEGENLTISQLMDCQWLSGSINKPLLVVIQQESTEKEIRALWEVGVCGVVVKAKEKAELVKLCHAIEALPSARRKPGEKRAVLPRIEREAESMTTEEI